MNSQSKFRYLSYTLFGLLSLYVLLTFNQYGISNDEEVQHVYGRLLLQFYGSGFTDLSAFHYKNLYLYGGLFDLIAASLEQLTSLWIWDLRHLISAVFGLVGIVGTYKTAKLLGGERAGFIAAWLLAITGAWSGAMFTHTKDIPFATGMIWAVFYATRFVMSLPKPALSDILKLGLAVGVALGLRVGGAFAVIYLILATAIAAWVSHRSLSMRLNALIKAGVWLIPAAIVAFIIMAFSWPWSIMAPDHLMQAAKAFSHFEFNMYTILGGHIISIDDVPRTYLLTYLSLRLPLLFLIGILLSALTLFTSLNKSSHLKASLIQYAPVVFAVIFPVTFALIDRPVLYNGIRHFSFLMPPLAVLAAIGLCATWDKLGRHKVMRNISALMALLLSLQSLITMAQLHPYEYMVYNPMAGNTKIATQRYEGDYWSSSFREAAAILEKSVPSETPARIKPYLVAVCSESIQGQAYFSPRFKVTKDWTAADFFISGTTMHCDKVLQGNEIGRIERLGAVLAVIKDRRNLTGNDRIPKPAPK